MVTLHKITPDLFSNLYDSFLIDDDPLSNEQDWRNVFDYAWDTDEGHCGYAMLDDGVVVGMIGMVFHERWIGGKRHKMCNLHTWWVREDYRGQSLLLLQPLLQLKDCTVTQFTPCDKVRAISKRLGFVDISIQMKLLLPPTGSRRRDVAEEAITYDLQTIEDGLDDHNRKLFRDHQPYGLGHLLIKDGSETCYVIYTYVQRRRLPYCHIHYFSNKSLFAAFEPTVRRALITKHKVPYAAIDTRLVEDLHLPRSFDFWAPVGGLYKTRDLRPDQIDNLYSDVVFLKLTTLPTIRVELKKLAGRTWSRWVLRRADTQEWLSRKPRSKQNLVKG